MTRKTPEGRFRDEVVTELQDRFPGCVILKNDEQSLQGVPDMLVLWNDRWAMLELKRSRFALKRPNQAYYIDQFNDMSFAAFIYPENKDDVLNALQYSFTSRW